jgi:hypothetical protein
MEDATARIMEAHSQLLDKLQEDVSTQLNVIDRLRTDIIALQAGPRSSELELTRLEAERSEAAKRHAEAEVEAAEKRRLLDRVTAGSLLEEFLSDLISADGYRKELTILSRARNHFERLSELMSKATDAYYKKDQAAPLVSRIVLYIDDLDRCPPELVMEVLRVVHLLLAFRLFVCVVAVDPRWLQKSLNQAPGLLLNGEESGLADLGKAATAVDYLEKIFQIPVWVRPVPVAQRSAMVRELLGGSGLESADAGHRGGLKFEAGQVFGAADAAVPEQASAQGPLVARDEVSQEELDYLDKLRELLDDNPRTLKRFVNTYRLVKSTLSDVELSVFLETQGNTSHAPYQVCMAQLAVLCGERKFALAMVQDVEKKQSSVAAWLDDLATRNDLAQFASKLRAALGNNTDMPLTTFQQWLEKTRRYSFYL